jgi:transcriptional regulator
MYVPTAFKQDDPGKLAQFIQKNNFATLFSGMSGNLQASHLPFLFKLSVGKLGTLVGHMAKANLHWQTIGPGEGVLTVFQGPHAYISPTWYEADNTVPTWNYAAVHVYGHYRSIQEPDRLRQILKELADLQEAALSPPWRMESLSKDFIDKMIGQIVGFEIEVTAMEGKWKLSQNHPEERRKKAIEGLRRQGNANSGAIADLMEGHQDV